MAITLRYHGHAVQPAEQETVLDALLRVGAGLPFSCKGGSCQTCLSQCTEGQVPSAAQKGLPEHLRQARYFLPCKCVPETSMSLQSPQPQDMITGCMLCETSGHDSGTIRVKFEPMRALEFRPGQTLRVVMGEAGEEPELRLSSPPGDDMMIEAELRLAPGMACPDWLGPEAVFGYEFDVRGPFFGSGEEEQPAPLPDPALWAALGDGALVRQVLDAFYPKVYADPQLSPFFARSTMSRAIEKQYSFLKQCMTGEKIYMGERPRNAHHWMIITPALFDHRQQIMIETLHEHGLTDEQIQRWTRFEEHYRADMVKDKVWPRRMDGQDVHTEGFAEEVLGEATLCDHCEAEIEQGTSVLYHRRLGTVSCPSCSAGPQAAGSAGV